MNLSNEQQLAEANERLTALEAEVAAMANGKLKSTVDIAAQTSERLNDVNAWLRRLA